MRHIEPDVRPLGIMAVALSVLSAVFAVSYFFSVLGYLAAAVAMVLGVIARTEKRSRTMGTLAVVVGVFAVVAATIVLFAL